MRALRRLSARRYLVPLREGGSLPAIVEADDGARYVLKFRGAGQGEKVLVAELLVGELARALGLRVPEIVLVDLDPAIGRGEPHAEIQDLLQRSVGLNLALAFVPEALAFDPASPAAVDGDLAARIVWLDALTLNVDRTARNTNLLVARGQLHLIDHGAALFFHYDWAQADPRSRSRFPQIRDHVLLPLAGDLRATDGALAPLLTPSLLDELVTLLPDAWLGDPFFATPEAARRAYAAWLQARLTAPREFVDEAEHARRRI